MLRMGRPRRSHKDLPRGLYKDPEGRFYLKAFTAEDIARLGGKSSVAVGRDPGVARQRWAEVYGFRDHADAAQGTIAELIKLFLAEDLPRMLKRKGKPDRPKYALRTQREYKRIAGHLHKRYGARRYARSEAEASMGDYFRTMDVSNHLREAEDAGKPSQGNRDMACLGSIFRYAKERGRTEYNPCRGAQRNIEEPREQEMHDEIFLELYGEAGPVLQCLMDLDIMVGSRVSDLLRIMESDWSERGLMAVPAKRKRGQVSKKQLFKRTEELAGVIATARAVKARTLPRGVSSVYLFASGAKGSPYTLSGFESMMRRAKERVARKRLAAQGIQAPTAEQVADGIRAVDIHFHDGRARAGEEAKKRGEDPADFLGNLTATARRHYLGRGVTELHPNAPIRAKEPGS
jgi:integrase